MNRRASQERTIQRKWQHWTHNDDKNKTDHLLYWLGTGTSIKCGYVN